MSASNKILQAAAGNAAGEAVYVEDVFSTYLYDGNKVDKDIVNGIDLAGEGGLVWIKARSGTYTRNHFLFDTERGATKALSSNTTAAESSLTNDLEVFNSDGFNLGTANNTNSSTEDYVSWSFRKQAGFFDVVTYTGDGTAGRAVSHNLGSVPGMIIVKMTSGVQQWNVYHRGAHSSTPENYRLLLDSTSDAGAAGGSWNNTAPTATEFTLGSGTGTNSSGQTYVAYLFAHDDQSFGDGSDEAIIECGTTDGSKVTLGWEPQWILHKSSNFASDWSILDVMRGMPFGQQAQELEPHTSDAEASSRDDVNSQNYSPEIYADGFKLGTIVGSHIYVAIRRPMKTPEAGTDVFAIDQPDSSSEPKYRASFPVDMAWFRSNITSTQNTNITNRLTGKGNLILNDTTAEANENAHQWDYMNGWFADQGTETNNRSWMFKRATGFFDVVAYVADQTSSHNHNLGVTPEFAIIKQRNGTNGWKAYHSALGNNKYLQPHTNIAAATDTGWASVNASTFFLKANNGNNIAYLWATVAGVSKVGSYTGTGSSQDIDCGFSAGARFVLIKRTNSSGDWYYWDSNRGIVAGNDPYLLWNSTGAQVTNQDYIDPLNAGFTVSTSTSALNASGSTYIFLAIA